YCASPGRFFVDLHEIGVLAWLAPELDLQFDGRPAGPPRWHPEIAHAVPLGLALEWAAANSQHLHERDRLPVVGSARGPRAGQGKGILGRRRPAGPPRRGPDRRAASPSLPEPFPRPPRPAGRAAREGRVRVARRDPRHAGVAPGPPGPPLRPTLPRARLSDR